MVGVEESLAYLIPEIAKQWHPTKNDKLKPENVTIGSSKKIWWVCSQGHEWKTSVKCRKNGTGCPYCSNKKILKGYNDLATLNPSLVEEWNYEKI